MGINKVQYGNTVLIDLTSDTVTADKLTQGYTAHDRTGALITGTATGGGSGGNVWQDAQGYVHLDDEGTTPITVEPLSVTQNGTYTATTGHAYSPVTVSVSGGGGGGLVYETGTWTPSEDVADYTISFVNTHTTAPFYYMIMDVGTTYNSTSNSNAGVIYYNWGQAFGEPLHYSSSSVRYGYARKVISSGGNTTASITYPHTSTTDTSASYPRYWAKETGIKADAYGSGYYWRAGRTYKWIAVWAPTT